jgi:hypothetical protein
MDKIILITELARSIFHKHEYKKMQVDYYECRCGNKRDIVKERWWEPDFNEKTEWMPFGYAEELKTYIKTIEDLKR